MYDRNETIKGYLAILATALLWSTGGLFIKLIPWSALSINSARCVVSLGVKTIQRKGFRLNLNRLTILAAVCFFCTTLFFSLANKYTTAANAILLQYAYPFFLMAYTWIFQKRRPLLRDLLTSLVIVAGIFLCCFDNLAAGGMLGILFGILSGISFSLYFFVNSYPECHTSDANCLGFILGIVVGLPWLVRETVFTFDILLYIVILGAFQLGLAYVIFEYGIKRVPPINAAFVAAIEPIASPIWVAVFYGEKMGPLAIIGGILVIGAVLANSIYTTRNAAPANVVTD